MPRYRLLLPVRAVSYYRLPNTGAAADGIQLTSGDEPTYTARVDVTAADAETAYMQAKEHVEHLLGYLSLLGETSAFILDGRNGLRASNLDLKESPVPPTAPPPPFEVIGGAVFPAGQEWFAARCDPDGSGRREGRILVFDPQPVLTPQAEKVGDLCALFAHREGVSKRVRIAIGIMHDAACARECESSFLQTFTALEVLTEDRREPDVLGKFFNEATDDVHLMDSLPYRTREDLLNSLREFLSSVGIPGQQIERIIGHVANTHSVSQVDVFCKYLAELGIPVERKTVINWREIRGALVHAAETQPEQVEAMRKFNEVVRNAVVEELRRAVPLHKQQNESEKNGSASTL